MAVTAAPPTPRTPRPTPGAPVPVPAVVPTPPKGTDLPAAKNLAELTTAYATMEKNPVLPLASSVSAGREPMTRADTKGQVQTTDAKLYACALHPKSGRLFAMIAQMTANDYLEPKDQFVAKSQEDMTLWAEARKHRESAERTANLKTPGDKARFAGITLQLYNDFAKTALKRDKMVHDKTVSDGLPESDKHLFFTSPDGKTPLIPAEIKAPKKLCDAINTDAKTRPKGNYTQCLEMERDPITGAPTYSITRREMPGFRATLKTAMASAMQEQSGDAMFGHFFGAMAAGFFAKKVLGRPYSNSLTPREVARYKTSGALQRELRPARPPKQGADINDSGKRSFSLNPGSHPSSYGEARGNAPSAGGSSVDDEAGAGSTHPASEEEDMSSVERDDEGNPIYAPGNGGAPTQPSQPAQPAPDEDHGIPNLGGEPDYYDHSTSRVEPSAEDMAAAREMTEPTEAPPVSLPPDPGPVATAPGVPGYTASHQAESKALI